MTSSKCDVPSVTQCVYYCRHHDVALAWLLLVRYLFSIIIYYRLVFQKPCRHTGMTQYYVYRYSTSLVHPPLPILLPLPPSLPPEYTALMSPNIGRNGSSSRLQFSCPCFYLRIIYISPILSLHV